MNEPPVRTLHAYATSSVVADGTIPGRLKLLGRVDTQIGESIKYERLGGTDDPNWKKAIPYESNIETVSRLAFKIRFPNGE